MTRSGGGKTLSTSSALRGRSARGGDSHSISVEEIDNGYLIRKCSMTDAGEYKSSCVYSPEPPKIEMDVANPPGGTAEGPLKRTVEYMGSSGRRHLR